jgi:hypothetical protein
MRRAAKVDGNHRQVVAAFKALGCTVQSLAAVGKGVPDLLVACAGLNHLVEVKNPKQPQNKRKLRSSQVVWASTWRAPRHLVESVEDVQRLVKAWRESEWVSMPHVDSPTLREDPTGTLAYTPPHIEQDFDADYNGRPPRMTDAESMMAPTEAAASMKRREARVTPNVVRKAGGA